MKKSLILLAIMLLVIHSACAKEYISREQRKLTEKYRILSLGGNRLILLACIIENTGLARNTPMSRIRLYGRLGVEAKEFIEFRYDKNGLLKHIKGPLGYGGDTTITFWHNSEGKITHITGSIGTHAEEKILLEYNERGILQKISGRFGFQSDSHFWFTHVHNGRYLDRMYGCMGYGCMKGLTFHYDRKGRLSAIRGKIGSGSDTVFRFSYDDSGKLTAISGRPGENADSIFRCSYLEFFPQNKTIDSYSMNTERIQMQ